MPVTCSLSNFATVMGKLDIQTPPSCLTALWLIGFGHWGKVSIYTQKNPTICLGFKLHLAGHCQNKSHGHRCEQLGDAKNADLDSSWMAPEVFLGQTENRIQFQSKCGPKKGVLDLRSFKSGCPSSPRVFGVQKSTKKTPTFGFKKPSQKTSSAAFTKTPR